MHFKRSFLMTWGLDLKVALVAAISGSLHVSSCLFCLPQLVDLLSRLQQTEEKLSSCCSSKPGLQENPRILWPWKPREVHPLPTSRCSLSHPHVLLWKVLDSRGRRTHSLSHLMPGHPSLSGNSSLSPPITPEMILSHSSTDAQGD